MIRQDMVSKMLIVLSMMLSVYLATFETTTLVVFPAFLLLTGLVLEWMLEKHRTEEIDTYPKAHAWKSIAFYTLVALAGIFLTGFMMDYSKVFAMSILSAVAFSAIMGVAEEQFFRGFITDFLASRFPNEVGVGFVKLPGWLVAMLSSAGIFTMYHLARYGGDPEAMMYVFAGGFILSFVAVKSKRISPCMLAHLLNNVFAVLGAVQ